MQSEYEVHDAAARVDAKTEKFEALDVSMQYNYALYLVHYSDHMNFIEGLSNLGEIGDMSNRQFMKLAPQLDVLGQTAHEIGDITMEDYNEVQVATRLATQFSWGTKYNPPFIHSSDALNAVAATLGKLGK